MDMIQRAVCRWLRHFSFCGEFFAVLMLCGLSLVIVACSGAGGGSRAHVGPTTTITIHIGDSGSPTPPLPPYFCGAWATNTTPTYNASSSEGVYAKFVRNVDGNPVGVNGATAVATIRWPDGSRDAMTALTTSDGLAVFAIPIGQKLSAINGITLVTVTFYKEGTPSCTVDSSRAAYFTLVNPTPSPTATGTATPPPEPTARSDVLIGASNKNVGTRDPIGMCSWTVTKHRGTTKSFRSNGIA